MKDSHQSTRHTDCISLLSRKLSGNLFAGIITDRMSVIHGVWSSSSESKVFAAFLLKFTNKCWQLFSNFNEFKWFNGDVDPENEDNLACELPTLIDQWSEDRFNIVQLFEVGYAQTQEFWRLPTWPLLQEIIALINDLQTDQFFVCLGELKTSLTELELDALRFTFQVVSSTDTFSKVDKYLILQKIRTRQSVQVPQGWKH